jgi:hypothetical protein
MVPLELVSQRGVEIMKKGGTWVESRESLGWNLNGMFGCYLSEKE